MSVLRRAKLRTPDGTESIEYPLGVEAENVEVANGENLSQRLARIDEDLEKNEEDIAAVNELAGINKQNIGANEIRIDALERRSASVNKKPYYFDTVADMKAYQGLKEGDMAITLGYYEANDGGKALYKIRNTTNEDVIDNSFIIEMNDDTLIAELIIDDLYIEQLGTKGNGIDDDTNILQKSIDFCINKKITLKSRGGKTFLISSSLNFSNKIDMDFNNSTIKTNSAIDMLVFNYLTGNEYQGFLKNIVIDMNNVATIGIHGIRIIKKLISGITIKNITGIGYQIDSGNEVIFENSHLYGSSNSSIGLQLNKGDCHYKDLIMIDVHTAIIANSTNFYSRIHAWIKTPSFVHNSVFFKSDTTNESFLNQCYSDTYYIGFKIERFHKLKLTEHYNHYNSTILNNTVLENIGGKVYFLHYSDKQYSQFTCIENSKIEGLNYSPTNSLLSNLNEYEKLVFIDSQTTLTDLNSKQKAIFYNDFTIESSDIELSNNKENVIKTQNNVSDLNLYINIINKINANTNTKILSFNSQYAPLSEKVFVAPFGFEQGYKISGYVFCTLSKRGELFINSSDNLPVNSRIYISKSYLNSIQS